MRGLSLLLAVLVAKYVGQAVEGHRDHRMAIAQGLALKGERLSHVGLGSPGIAAHHRNQAEIVQVGRGVRMFGAARPAVDVERLPQGGFRAGQIAIEAQDRCEIAEADRDLAMQIAEDLPAAEEGWA